jgi:5'-nucleotidase
MKAKYSRYAIFLASGLALFILAVYAHASYDGGRELTLTILHSNDLHAHDESFMERGHSIGGMARIAHLIKAFKQNRKNVLAIDAGDFFQGTTLFQQYGGEVEVSLLNQAGYDIVALGNHEFDNGPEALAKQLKAAKFTIISCNVDFSKVPELEAMVKPSLVKEINGERVAFIGAVTPELDRLSLKTTPAHIKAKDQDWIQPIKAEVDRYKQQGINKIILVTHCGVDLDKELAQSLSDVDAIVGGHSHTRLDKPIWVKHPDGSKTIIVQTGCYGRALGDLDLAFDKKGELIESDTHDRLININERIQEEPEVATYVREKNAPLIALRSEIVGFAESEFDNRFNNMPWDSPIGDLLCDALIEEGASYGATIAFQNRGGIRARIERGPISEEKVRELLPFDNRVVLATIDGEHLRAVLEHSVDGMLGGHFLDVRGIKFGYDPIKSPGHRLVFVLAADARGDWRPIKSDGTYKIVVNDYTFKGGEGYEFSGVSDVVRLPDLLSQAFHKYLIKHKTINAQAPNRIVPVTGGMASLVRRKDEILAVQLPTRSAKAVILFGKELGAEPYYKLAKTLPVPISGISEAEDFKGKQAFIGQTSCWVVKVSELKKWSTYPYAVVVCRPTKSTPIKDLKVSYPLVNQSIFSSTK